MTISQPDKATYLTLVRNATFALLILAGTTACSNSLESAAAQGAEAEQHLASGRIQAARQAISRAIAERDDMVELHLVKGRIELAARSTASAYDAYNDALALDPVNREALQAVSQLGLSTGHIYESLQATERILSLDPGAPNALLVRGVHALVRRRADEAISYADKVLARSTAREEATIREDAIILKARALFQKGNHETALASLDAAADRKSPTPALALTKLEIFRELRRPGDMAQQFTALHDLRPDDGALRLDEANMRFKLGEREAAHRLVIATLADAKVTRELIIAAVRLWEEYGAGDSRSEQIGLIAQRGTTEARGAVARFLIETGDFSNARTLLRSLTGNDRASLSARLEARLGRHQSALKIAEAVTSRDATQCDALIAQSEASLAIGVSEAALVSGQRASAECPAQPAAWIAAAQAYIARGRPSGAERVYRQAVEAHPQTLRLAREYSEWLLANGRKRESVAIARRVTRSAPALLGGWRYYADVCRRAGGACVSEATQGLQSASTVYGIDLEPGAMLPHGLIGRLRR